MVSTAQTRGSSLLSAGTRLLYYTFRSPLTHYIRTVQVFRSLFWHEPESVLLETCDYSGVCVCDGDHYWNQPAWAERLEYVCWEGGNNEVQSVFVGVCVCVCVYLSAWKWMRLRGYIIYVERGANFLCVERGTFVCWTCCVQCCVYENEFLIFNYEH